MNRAGHENRATLARWTGGVNERVHERVHERVQGPIEPATFWVETPNGRCNFVILVAWMASNPAQWVMTIRGVLGPGGDVKVSLYLRHNPALARKDQPPGVLYITAEYRKEASTGNHLVGAARAFVRSCAESMPPSAWGCHATGE
jgi:hypothetical protein